jgi:hypothetical protein
LNALAKFSFKVIRATGPRTGVSDKEDPFAHSPIGTGLFKLKNVSAKER